MHPQPVGRTPRAPEPAGFSRARRRKDEAVSSIAGTWDVTVKSPAGGGSVKSRNAACSWKVPKSAKGKTIRGTITLTESGVANTRSFTTHVR